MAWLRRSLMWYLTTPHVRDAAQPVPSPAKNSTVTGLLPKAPVQLLPPPEASRLRPTAARDTKVHQPRLVVGQLSTCDAIDAIPVGRCQCEQSSAGASRGGATWRITVALLLRSDQGSRPALLAPRHLSPMRAAHGPQPSIHNADASASAAAGHLSCTTGGLAPQHRPRGLCFMRCCCHCIV